MVASALTSPTRGKGLEDEEDAAVGELVGEKLPKTTPGCIVIIAIAHF